MSVSTTSTPYPEAARPSPSSSNSFEDFPVGGGPFPTVPMDPANATVQNFLRRIQGNIFKSHGRAFTRLLLFQFARTSQSNRLVFPAARRQSPPLITSALEQYNASPGQSGLTGTEFYSVMLTNSGLAACGYDKLNGEFPPEIGATEFANGVAVDNSWDAIYRGGDSHRIDGIWLLAHESEGMLLTMQNKVEVLLRRYASILHQEDGFVWRDAPPAGSPVGTKGNPREPFGFRDGISEPVILSATAVNQPWVQTDLTRVVIPDRGPHFGGSFMAFSKLDQNVAQFRATERSMHNLPATVREGGALFVGRERDGTPLVGAGPGGLNDFNFDTLPASDGRCPFHAHIRKSNPRSNDPVVRTANHNNDPKPAQFIRRSVVYDQPPQGQPKQLPAFASSNYAEGDAINGNVGLLFMAYMRDIGSQFHALRFDWFFNQDFPVLGSAPKKGRLDPLVGTGGESWSWPATAPSVQLNNRPQFVRSRGDLYLYAPPISWLESPPR